VSEDLEKENYRERQPWWTESIALGSKGFVRKVKEKLGAKAMWRKIIGGNGADFALKNEGLRQNNILFGNISL
jgi:hypothetical protein